MFKLAMKMLKKDWKSSVSYIFVMILTIAIHFIFTCSSNVELMPRDGIDLSSLAKGSSGVLYELYHMGAGATQGNSFLPPSDYLNGVIVFFCCFLMFYMNKNYIYNKKKEMAILSVSGASVFQIIFSYLSY